MLVRRILLFALVLVSFPLAAAKKRPPLAYRDDTQGEGYFSIFGFSSFVSWKPMPGNFQAQFPYKLTNPWTGAVVNDTFSCSMDNFTGSGKFAYPGIGLEIGRGSFTVEASIGAYLKGWSDGLFFGLNYRFVLKSYPVRPRRFVFGATSFPGERSMERFADFPVKLSLGWFYYQPIWKLGEIKIDDNQFDALGYTFQSRDSALSGQNGTVIVLFHQNILSITPGITFGYRPLEGRADLSLRVAPLFIYNQSGGLRLKMRNNYQLDWAPRDGISADAVIPLDTYSLNAQFNGNEIRKTPFKFRCIMYTLRIGIRIV
jgi:hypothetical protein